MAEPCGSGKPGFGHNDCNYQFVTVEREWRKAPADAWRNSKNKVYKKKRIKQGS